ncbi:MAG: helix-turn-helix domain-containing protein [Planctomycetota bacterium]
MPRKRTHLVEGAALSALATARRLELIEALMSEQPATVEELGRYLGREPRSLYHHLRPLLKAGLIEEAGQRETSRRPATLYRLPAERLELNRGDRSPRSRALLKKLARSTLQNALRLQERAVDGPATSPNDPRHSAKLAHRAARLTPAGLKQIHQKMRELFELLGELHDEEGVPTALTISLAPAAPGE